MPPSEPHATALLLVILGLLMAVSVASSRVSSRFGIPLVLLFLGVGMLAGSEGLGRVHFEDYALTLRLGSVCLILILFEGGLNTPLATVKESLGPATTLATLGVVVTALLVAAGAMLFGLSWGEALLLGAMVSSTDAAAVFSVLRSTGTQVKEQVSATLELESGLNDPMAVILTIALTEALAEGRGVHLSVVPLVFAQLVVGAVVGCAAGYGGRALLRRLRLAAGGLYPVLTVALSFLAFGVASLAYGSGFLAVYVAGFVLGNGLLPYRSALLRVHDFLGWCSQVVMFAMLGLLVFPSRLVSIAPVGLGIALLLSFAARPLAVALCLFPFGYRRREVIFVGWAGLRGAVPIMLATIPILAGFGAAHRLFDIIFFVVVVSVLLNGSTLRWLSSRLALGSGAPPPPPAALEIASTQPLSSELMSFYIGGASAVCGAQISELPFPDGSAAMLIVRGDALIAPRGKSVLEEGDHVYVFCRAEDRPLISLLFGKEAES